MNDILLISVLGVGSYGAKAMNMIMDKMQKNDQDDTFITNKNSNEFVFYAIDTDSQTLTNSKVQDSLLLSDALDQESLADQKLEEKLQQMVGDSDLVILVAGMGGQTASTLTPAIADRLKAINIPTTAVVFKPFGFEGGKSEQNAEIGISKLAKLVTTLKVLENNDVTAKAQNQSEQQIFAQVDSEVADFVLSFSEKHFVA
ncbi:hypothetical protein ACLSZN_08040 [Avibacterium avium]|uniref:hypothetical protein n=1 Tax=Avibacterium avium TaxID=751 RepID=UPI003BF81110